MRRFEHVLIGVGAGALVAHVTGGNPAWLMAASGIAASLPDTDLRWANRWHRPKPGSPCGLLEHRGPTHSLLAALVVGLIAQVLWPTWGLSTAVGIGYLSHLAADALSPMGEPFLWPLSRRRYRVVPWRALRIHSGTRLIELPLAVAVLAVCLSVSGQSVVHLSLPSLLLQLGR